MCVSFVQKMYKMCWSKEFFFYETIVWIVRCVLYECHMSDRCRFKECQIKEKYIIFLRSICITFLTLVYLFRHVSYECHISLGHYTHLLLEVFVLHRYLFPITIYKSRALRLQGRMRSKSLWIPTWLYYWSLNTVDN